MSPMREPPILRPRKINHLPYDIVLNIMERLPVKSVMRFRCVSKSMDSSITTHDFISAHLNNINKNHDHENGYVIHMPSWEASHPLSSSPHPDTPVCTVAFDRTFDRISEVRIPFDFDFKGAQIVGSCNGLLCLATLDNVIYLWNPSIRKFKRLPDTCLGKLKSVSVRLGFAYRSENDDYKVVRISTFTTLIHEVEVYTSSSDSWRRVGNSSTDKFVFCYKNLLVPAPLVSGALHWMAFMVEGQAIGPRRSIMSFDVNTETFRKLALPNYTGSSYCISLFKGKLAFITHDKHGSQYSIWVMKNYAVVESWNKLFVVPFQRAAYCHAFTEYGSLLVSYSYLNDLVWSQGFKIVLIDAETLHEKKDPDIQCPSYVATFMESLVLLDDGAKAVSY
ncbi:hypothetical protein CMV_015679 [Castanea mollissima]|uniref:F-box domain-containing protein n=1 Tax=Castanea mollissima TaxID=60419 RepID=A0A8J4VSD8_9ROSI|nr:hypothetical protein CMV_015679 [Castanea mollissima]